MISKFDQRSYEKEKIDVLHVSGPDLEQNLEELDFINTWLGGYAISYSAIQNVYKTDRGHAVSVLDIGCGAGDLIAYLAKKTKGLNYSFAGLDANPNIISYARQKHPSLTFISADAFDAGQYPEGMDIIHACLFCHHFTEEELVRLFSVWKSRAVRAVVINDLQRHPLAYYSIKWLTALFSGSEMVKHDAPLSVWRGFRKKELIQMFRKAGYTSIDIRWKWAFRYQVIAWI